MQLFEQGYLFPLGLDLAAAREIKERIMTATHAKNTTITYSSSWRMFQRWCREAGKMALPTSTQTCLDFAAWCIADGYRLETVEHRLKAINYFHRQAELPLPMDRSVWQFLNNAKRVLCEDPQGMAPLSPEQLRRISEALLDRKTLLDVRDRAVILVGFACGWRRCELAALNLCDVRWSKEGIEIWLAKSKTDQAAKGRLVGIPRGEHPVTCPVAALDKWVAVRGRWYGPLFTATTPARTLTRRRCHPDMVRIAVKRCLQLIGEDPEGFGAHSLRAGMITASAEAGATETSIMQRTGHRSYQTLRRYIRPATVFRANPLKGVL